MVKQEPYATVYDVQYSMLGLPHEAGRCIGVPVPTENEARTIASTSAAYYSARVSIVRRSYFDHDGMDYLESTTIAEYGTDGELIPAAS